MTVTRWRKIKVRGKAFHSTFCYNLESLERQGKTCAGAYLHPRMFKAFSSSWAFIGWRKISFCSRLDVINWNIAKEIIKTFVQFCSFRYHGLRIMLERAKHLDINLQDITQFNPSKLFPHLKLLYIIINHPPWRHIWTTLNKSHQNLIQFWFHFD